MLEMHRLAPELEDALDIRMIERLDHQTSLHGQDLIRDALDYREIVGHDEVEDAVGDILRTFPGMNRDARCARSQLMIERQPGSADRDDASLGQEDADVGIDDLVGSKLCDLGDDEDV